MKAILIDAYRHKDNVVLWLKTPDNIRIVKKFSTCVYLEHNELAYSILNNNNLPYAVKQKRAYTGQIRKVYEVPVRISRYEKIVRLIEISSKHRLNMYNADIPPEQMFLYKNNLTVFKAVEVNNNIVQLKDEVAIPLEKMEISFTYPITSITVNDETIIGNERDVLSDFCKRFISLDPDVILMERAFSKLPKLIERLDYYNITCPFNRWDDKKIKYKGGKSFHSYGRVIYRDYAIRLNGRFLVDTGTMIGSDSNIEGIIELSQLSGQRFQQIASRSFGAVFQASLIRELVKRDYLVPFKEKPVDQPISMHHLLKFDRVGHTFDSLTGMHKNVAEIDFSSLFPWLIYNYNISVENFDGEPPYQDVPGLPVKISLKNKGVVPSAIKPLLDRRMHYKKNPTALNKAKTQGLKWVLVCSYGYLRFREFKLGIATSHMAIGSFAREIMIKAKNICEEKGYKIVHGIIDSLYIQKKGINESDVREICREIELETGIPVSFEGLFKWIVFLPSVNDINRPLPSHYYGVFNNGDIKVRGIEVRQRKCPKIVKTYQKKVLEIISKCNNEPEIINMFPYLCQLLRKTIFLLPSLDSRLLSTIITLGKTDYKHNIAQKKAIEQLKHKGITVLPGQKVSYVYSDTGVILPEDYNGRVDIDEYKKLLVRSLFVVMQPFGFTKQDIYRMIQDDRQTKIREYQAPLHTHEQEIQMQQGVI